MIFRGGEVSGYVEIICRFILQKSFATIFPNIPILDQTFLVGRDAEHHLLHEGCDLPIEHGPLIRLRYEVIVEAVLPRAPEFLTRARELLTDRPDVHIPSTAFHGLDHDVVLGEGRTVEDYLPALRIEGIVHALVHGVLDGLHLYPAGCIVVADQVIEDRHDRTLAEQLRTTDTRLGPEHLAGQLLAVLVPELDEVVCEVGVGHPFLQELTIFITEFDVFPGGFYTVFHTIRHINQIVDFPEIRQITIEGEKQDKVFEK